MECVFHRQPIWAKWGFDGESAIVADFRQRDGECGVDIRGKDCFAVRAQYNRRMWYGTKKLQLKSISLRDPAGVTESYNVNTGVIAFTVASGISMPARSEVRSNRYGYGTGYGYKP